MTLFIIYLITCLGVTYAWTDTDVSAPARNLVARVPYIRSAMLCHECSSFWFSLGISFLINPLEGLKEPMYYDYLILAFCGFFTNLLFVRNRFVAFKE